MENKRKVQAGLFFRIVFAATIFCHGGNKHLASLIYSRIWFCFDFNSDQYVTDKVGGKGTCWWLICWVCFDVGSINSRSYSRVLPYSANVPVCSDRLWPLFHYLWPRRARRKIYCGCWLVQGKFQGLKLLTILSLRFSWIKVNSSTNNAARKIFNMSQGHRICVRVFCLLYSKKLV